MLNKTLQKINSLSVSVTGLFRVIESDHTHQASYNEGMTVGFSLAFFFFF